MTLTSDLGYYAIDGKNALIINDDSVNSIEQGIYRILSLSKEQISSMKQIARITGETKFDYRAYLKESNLFLNKIR